MTLIKASQKFSALPKTQERRVARNTQEETRRSFELHLFLEQLMCKETAGRFQHKDSRRPMLRFPFRGILHLSRCGPVKRQGVNAVRRCLKHTLLFSNFTIVLGEIKRALLTCCCVRQAFMSYLITEQAFFDWAEVWEESGPTMRAGRLSPIVQCEGNKDVVWNPSRGAGLPHFMYYSQEDL